MPVVIVPRVSVPVVRVATPVVRSAPVARSAPPPPPAAKVPAQEIHTTNTATNVALGVAVGMATQSAMNSASARENVETVSVEGAEIKSVEKAPMLPGQTVDLHKSTVLTDADTSAIKTGPHAADLFIVGGLMILICTVAYFTLPNKMRGHKALALLTLAGAALTGAIVYWKSP